MTARSSHVALGAGRQERTSKCTVRNGLANPTFAARAGVVDLGHSRTRLSLTPKTASESR